MEINVGWTTIKDFVDERSLNIQYVDLTDCYQISAFDGNFVLTSRIEITDPRNSDQTDFEDNYKDGGNQTLSNTRIVSGNINGSNSVEISCDGAGTIIAEIQDAASGWTGEIGFYSTLDGTNWYPVSGTDLISYDGNLPVTATPTYYGYSARYAFNAAGYKKIRLTGQTVGGGGADITLCASVGSSIQEAIHAVTFVSGAITSVALPTGAATETTLNDIKTSVQLIDDAVYTDGSGTPSKAIGIAGTDGTNPQIIKTDSAGELQIDVLTLPNITIGAAIPAGNNNIGDVDVVTLPVGHNIIDSGTVTTVTNLSQMNGVAISLNTGVRDSGTQRVTIATNDIVPASQSGTWNINNVSGTVSLPTGASTLTEQQSQTTSLQLIDDGIYTSGTGSPTKGMLALGTDGTNPRSIKTDTSGELQVDVLTLPVGHNIIDSGTLTTVSTVTSLTQLNGAAISMNTGVRDSGTLRVTIATNDSVPVTLGANQSINNAQVNGGTVITSVTGVQDVMPRKRTGATGLSPNYSASHITTKTTTTPTAATAYVSAIAIACSGAGTAWTMVIQNKEGTPKILVPSFTLTVPTTGLPVILQFAEPIIMTSGIDIVTGGTTAGTVDVFITYWN